MVAWYALTTASVNTSEFKMGVSLRCSKCLDKEVLLEFFRSQVLRCCSDAPSDGHYMCILRSLSNSCCPQAVTGCITSHITTTAIVLPSVMVLPRIIHVTPPGVIVGIAPGMYAEIPVLIRLRINSGIVYAIPDGYQLVMLKFLKEVLQQLLQ